MKSMSFLFLVLASFLLVSCNQDDQVVPNSENSWSPLSCEGADNCKTEWNFYFKRDGFPTNVSIYVNNVKVVDECSPDGTWIMRRAGAKVEFRKDNYSSIKKTDKISLRVIDMGQPCGVEKTEFLYMKNQTFTVTNNDTDNYVVIEN